MGDRSPSPCSSPLDSWAPVICSSPIHSGGLCMDNPFEMFDEVGRSLKWFSLSRNAPGNAVSATVPPSRFEDPPPHFEDAASEESYNSDSSSTISWNKNSGELDMGDEDYQGPESSPLVQCEEFPEALHDENVEQQPRDQEPLAMIPMNEDQLMCKENRGMTENQFPQTKPETCLYSKIPPAVESDKDPVSGLVRSFFCVKKDARKVPDELPKKNNDADRTIEKLEKKIEMLEAENSRVKKECQRLNKLLKEKEDESAHFAQDKAAWERQSLCSMREYNAEKEELLQELKREKRLLEKRFQALSQIASPLPNKGERREIADLKAKLVDVHEEHLKKEARLRLTNIRLRKHVKEVSGLLDEKQEEIKRYERLLLDYNARDEKPVKSETSPEEAPGYRTIKKVECLSSDSADIGCRITGALFYQRPDCRAKHKKEVPANVPKSTSEKKKKASPKKLSTTSSIIDGSSGVPDCVREHKQAVPISKEKSSSELGTEDGASMDGTFVEEHGIDHESVLSDVLSEDRSRSKGSSLKETPRSQRRSLVFTDGTREEEYQDGLACLYFPNGDIKNSLADGTTEYYYSEVDTWHTTKPDGVEIFYFPENQIEEHWPDGRKRVIFPDGTATVEC